MNFDTIGPAGVIFAFGAGLLSFLSPCILPLIPAYLSYLGGSAALVEGEGSRRWLLVRRAVLFVLGFSLVFILLGASATLLGSFLLANRELFRRLAGLIIIAFGVVATGLVPWARLYGEKRLAWQPRGQGEPVAFLLGLAFAMGWTPCVGPALASILVYAGSTETVRGGMVLLGVYSMGLGLPFIAAALLFERFAAFKNWFRRFLPRLSLVMGGILVVFGLLVFFNRLAWLTPAF